MLEEGETEPPQAFREAFRVAENARRIMQETIKPGRTALETLDILNGKYRDGHRPVNAAPSTLPSRYNAL